MTVSDFVSAMLDAAPLILAGFCLWRWSHWMTQANKAHLVIVRAWFHLQRGNQAKAMNIIHAHLRQMVDE